ncbi:MAG: hypothetical protein KAW12_04355 [Candidatus Aminicenantes bacterium]|nr:hypothetical protein [Candidatus Aminicenantes bacterium]
MIQWKILSAAIAVGALISIYVRRRRSLTARRIIQPITTTLVIVLAASGCLFPGSNTIYTMLVVLYLIFCLIGDCYLVDFKDNNLVLVALGFYWAGIIVYSVVLTRRTGFNLTDLTAFIILLIGCGLAIALFLWKGLGKMKAPVIIYILTWCYLLSQSLTIFWSDSVFFSATQKWLILAGTGIFFLGDIIISFHQFNEKFQKKLLWMDVPLYYTGQGLIAISTSFF